jgi:hypothetical protein
MVLRASEIVQFVFCRRAWWYTKHGHPSAYEERHTAGAGWHRSHGRTVFIAGCLRVLGYAFLFAAIVATAAYLTSLVLG